MGTGGDDWWVTARGVYAGLEDVLTATVLSENETERFRRRALDGGGLRLKRQPAVLVGKSEKSCNFPL
jgi:hypothetical protein